MLRKLLSSALAIIIMVMFSPASFAQAPTPATGDYGSVASGNWGALSTWKQLSQDGTGVRL
jgi:hypothetical protein